MAGATQERRLLGVGSSAWLGGGLGLNEAILRGILSFKISRFVDGYPAYPVEVAICRCQLREPLCTHKGKDKGIVRQ